MISLVSSERGRRQSVTLVLLLAAVVLAGCNLFQSPADTSATLPNASEAAARYDAVDGFRATVNTTLERDGNVSWTVQQMAGRPGTGDFRNVIVATGPATAENSLGVGSRIVSNGSIRYIYAAGTDTVQRSRVDGERRNRSADIARLFAELRDDDNGTIRRPTPGVSSLPVVPGDGETGSAADNDSVAWRDEQVTVQYRGEETVAGRSTYVVELRPASADASLVEATLWLDAEYLFPLKRHGITRRSGERYEYTTVYRNVTFDPAFEPGFFEPDPDDFPANATTIQSESYDTRAEMVAALDQPVPDPTVPERFAFAGGFFSDGEFEHLSLRYATPDGRESIRLSVFAESSNLSNGRRVSIEGKPAAFVRFHGNQYLNWNADGRQYSLSGTVGNATLRRVAASLLD